MNEPPAIAPTLRSQADPGGEPSESRQPTPRSAGRTGSRPMPPPRLRWGATASPADHRGGGPVHSLGTQTHAVHRPGRQWNVACIVARETQPGQTADAESVCPRARRRDAAPGSSEVRGPPARPVIGGVHRRGTRRCALRQRSGHRQVGCCTRGRGQALHARGNRAAATVICPAGTTIHSGLAAGGTRHVTGGRVCGSDRVACGAFRTD